MSEFKGTKGEWLIDNNYKGMILTEKGGYKPNAMLNTMCSDIELEANAKLISCAPDMLEELKYILTNYDLGVTDKYRLESLIKKAIG